MPGRGNSNHSMHFPLLKDWCHQSDNLCQGWNVLTIRVLQIMTGRSTCGSCCTSTCWGMTWSLATSRQRTSFLPASTSLPFLEKSKHTVAELCTFSRYDDCHSPVKPSPSDAAPDRKPQATPFWHQRGFCLHWGWLYFSEVGLQNRGRGAPGGG